MKTSELLDELRNNILNDRGTSTGDDDKLWSDAALMRYINEAQKRFAKRSFCVIDGTTTAVCEVTLVEGVTQYSLHKAVLAVISAKIEDHDYDLIRVGHSRLGDITLPGQDVNFDPALLNTTASDLPRAFTTDEMVVSDGNGSMSNVSMRVWPAPRAQDAGTVVQLRVARMPITDLAVASPDAYPELPDTHHLEMLDWAAYLALRIIDQDAGAPKRASEFAASFEQHVQDARKLVLRKLGTPSRYAFGRGGFAWGS